MALAARRLSSLSVAVAAAGLVAACGPAPVEIDPAPPVLRRLTADQYENAVRDLIGADVVMPPEPEPDLELTGLVSLGSASSTISPRGVERYESAAYALAAQAVDPSRRGRIVLCTPRGTRDDACAGTSLGAFGRRAWRRLLTAEELATVTQIAGDAAEVLGDFHEGLSFGLALILQSPDFLMRPEAGVPAAGGRRYTGFELAGRLSFLVWDSVPDDPLLDAAELGLLEDPKDLRDEVRRMLDDPRARRGLRAWVADLLGLDDLAHLQKDPTVFVEMSDAVGTSAREETLRAWEDVIFDADADLRDVFTTRRTFVDRTLATIYRIPAPVREGFGEVALPEGSPRVGFFGNASFLALQAHPTATSATNRGRFIREMLLCAPIPDPPAGVDTSIPEVSADALTRRQRVSEHLENPGCAACHVRMDPIGLAFERFDGIGVFRETENGARIDASGELDGVPFDDARGMAEALVEHPDLVPCLVRQLTRHAVGHDPTDAEQPALDALVEQFTRDDHRLLDLVAELVQSPIFLTVGEPE